MNKEMKEKKVLEPQAKTITPDERRRMLVDGIKKTIVPAFIGAFFALLFFIKFGDATAVSYLLVLLLVVLSSYYIQRLVYPLIGVKSAEFETKDWLYVEFFTVIFFIVFWILLLNTGSLDITATPDIITTGVPADIVIRISSGSSVIKGASVNLSGYGVNLSSTTGQDGLAHFYKVNASGPGNITASARLKGYISGHLNITSIK